MNALNETATYLNILGEFCGRRDIPELTKSALKDSYHISQADVMVLFGGSILCDGDVLAQAIKNNIAQKYVIVGGAGHTTETLRRKVHSEFPNIHTGSLPEAQIFAEYIKHKYGFMADYLETKSTNCGNNITFLLDLLKQNHISFQSIILVQDASMQLRMDAGFRKYASENLTIINYASYKVTIIEENSRLVFKEKIFGMWNMEHYITLLMGEIPRLRDDKNGYDPNEKNFIAHVEIPRQVENAFYELQKIYTKSIREANPLYAS